MLNNMTDNTVPFSYHGNLVTGNLHFNCNILHIFAENFILKINLLKYVDSFIIVHPTNPKHLSVVT